MKKIAVLFLTIMLVVGIAGLTQAAKKEKPEALATIVGMGCVVDEVGPIFGLQASWSWSAGTYQTKFGGCAVYMVEVTIDGEPDSLAADNPDALEIFIEGYALNWVNVKAMDPGTGSKRQNYPLVDVCVVPPPINAITL